MQMTSQQANEALEDINKAGRKLRDAVSNRVAGQIGRAHV